MFGLSLAASAMPFPRAPASLFERCPELVNEAWSRVSWEFVRLDVGATSFLAIGGYFVNRAQNTREPDWKGALVALSPGHCELIGPPRSVLDYGAADTTDEMRRDFAEAAVNRYAAVLGGMGTLRKLLTEQQVTPAAPRSALLAQALETPESGARP